jgi:hypothetical protein
MATSIRALVPDLQPFAYALVDSAAQSGWSPRVTSTRRSHREQSFLYRRFLAGLSSYPAAPPGHSAHELGLALDLIVTPYEALEQLGSLWESWGGRWGGRGTDPIHFESGDAPAVVKSLFQRTLESPIATGVSLFLPTPLTYRFNTPEEDRALDQLADSIRHFFR